MTVVINGDTGVSGVDGTAGTPALQGNDTNTGIFFPAADTIAFAEGGTEVARFDSSGNLGIGTSSPVGKLHVNTSTGYNAIFQTSGTTVRVNYLNDAASANVSAAYRATDFAWQKGDGAEVARIDPSGNLLVGKTADVLSTVGTFIDYRGSFTFTRSGATVGYINRLASDGALLSFLQDTTEEGTISVSGTTVSYNGGHLSRWAQTTVPKDESLLKGTVLSNLDEMNVYTDAEGNPVANEQLNKVKVSDVEGDSNVAGVFVNWTHDDAHDVDEINMAMTGDMIIRIAQGVTVARGDLLMSAGDGTAKPQGDDIIRSKTVAKVTSTHVTCTYADGSYCVPCVLMAC